MDDEFVSIIYELEKQGVVTRTFRRLDPERQEVVVQAILDEAAEVGPADLSIKGVANRAGVAVGSLYQYFGSRERLLEFAMELVVHSTVTMFRSYRPYLEALPLVEGLQAYLEGGIEWTQQQLGFARFFARAAYQGDPALSQRVVEPVAREMRAMVDGMLQAASARGEIRSDADLAALGRVLNTLLIATADAQLIPWLNTYYQALDEQVALPRYNQALTALIKNGLLAPMLNQDAAQ